MVNDRALGLHPDHVGFLVGHNFYSPSHAAEGFIGATPANNLRGVVGLEERLHGVVERILDDDKRAEETPVLSYLVRKIDEQGERFDLNAIRALVKKAYGTSKLIDQEAVTVDRIPKESMRGQFVGTVKTRRSKFDRTHQDHTMSVYDVLVDDASDGQYISFAGGTEHAQTHLRRGSHWSRGISHESDFIDLLRRNGNTTYDEGIHVVDYASSAFLTYLHQMQSVGLLGSKGDISDDAFVFMPFDFSKRDDLAFEVLAMRYASVKDIKGSGSSLSGKATLIDVDRHMMGKRGFVQPFMKELYASGGATRSVLPKGKRLDNHTWAIMQAWEEHAFGEGRDFRGYSLEFPGCEYETTSIVFDFHNGKHDVSMRLLVDDHFGLPMVMYKSFVRDEYYGTWRHSEKDPANRVNISDDLRTRDWVYRHHEDVDWHSGRENVSSIFQPTDAILERASELTRAGGKRGVSAGEFRKRYVNNYFRIKNKVK